jgi:hypothetical protein
LKEPGRIIKIKKVLDYSMTILGNEWSLTMANF